MIKFFICLISIFSLPVMAQQTDTTFLQQLMQTKPELFQKVLNHPNKNEIQLMYTQVNRDKNNKPSFKTYTYNLNNKRYFYPASTVKLASVIFALEKINGLKAKGITAYTKMLTDSSYKGQTKVLTDQSAVDGKPTIAHYIKKILLTSDNDAFNRLFEFIGRAEINSKLKKHEMFNSRILNRLAIGDGGEAAKHTNPINFYEGEELIYHQDAQYDVNDYPLELTNLIVGKGYIDANEKLVNEPYNFADKNVFTIADQQLLMMKLMMPEAFAKKDRFNLTPQDYKLIYTYMSKLPTESEYPKINEVVFWPTYAKMVFYGRDKNAAINNDIRIFNKYGDSYGYIIDNVYFVDFKNKVEFFLTAVVQSNEDGIYNDGQYEYETVCYPFMKNIGQEIYKHELNRNKKQLPDLSKYKMDYKF